MLHIKFQNHMILGYSEEDFKTFYHMWTWWPSWACNKDYFFKKNSYSLLPKRLHMKFGFDWPSGSRENVV